MIPGNAEGVWQRRMKKRSFGWTFFATSFIRAVDGVALGVRQPMMRSMFAMSRPYQSRVVLPVLRRNPSSGRRHLQQLPERPLELGVLVLQPILGGDAWPFAVVGFREVRVRLQVAEVRRVEEQDRDVVAGGQVRASRQGRRSERIHLAEIAQVQPVRATHELPI